MSMGIRSRGPRHENLGKELERYIHKNHITKAELARRLDIPYNTIFTPFEGKLVTEQTYRKITQRLDELYSQEGWKPDLPYLEELHARELPSTRKFLRIEVTLPEGADYKISGVAGSEPDSPRDRILHAYELLKEALSPENLRQMRGPDIEDLMKKTDRRDWGEVDGAMRSIHQGKDALDAHLKMRGKG